MTSGTLKQHSVPTCDADGNRPAPASGRVHAGVTSTQSRCIAVVTSEVAAQLKGIRSAFWDESASPSHLFCDRHDPDAIAFRFVEPDLTVRDLTFGELAVRSRQAAQVLADLGVGAGDRVATLMGKGIDLPGVILGIWRLGAVYVPLFTASAAMTVEDRVVSADVKVLVTDDAQADKTRSLECTVLIGNRAYGRVVSFSSMSWRGNFSQATMWQPKPAWWASPVGSRSRAHATGSQPMRLLQD
ncbi:MAG: AMP-binding protein [Mycetocola sp.]